MALMHLARRWLDLTHRSPAGFAVATIDHGLRAESKDEAAFVASAAQALDFKHTTIAWEGEKPKTGIQAAARRARYDLLASACRAGAKACVVTAHTEDDQAETVLMRLRRGSGVDGLAGMDAVSEWDGVAVVRPLLSFSKARLLAYLRASSVPFVRDPSNENPAFERVRLRRAAKALAAAGIRGRRWRARPPALGAAARRSTPSRTRFSAGISKSARSPRAQSALKLSTRCRKISRSVCSSGFWLSRAGSKRRRVS